MNADFRRKGASPTNHSWYQTNRVIALSFGIKISAVRHLVLSQCMRVTDRETDRITTPKTALAYARAVKTEMYQIRFRLGLCPRTRWGAYSLAGFKGPISKAAEGKGKEGRPVFSVQFVGNLKVQQYNIFCYQVTIKVPSNA